MCNSTESQRRAKILERLQQTYSGSAAELCVLKFDSPFQLLVATILSAQCTDERVNATTPALFESYGSAEEIVGLSEEDLGKLIYSTGFYKNKARNILAMARELLINFGGEVPETMEELVALPGVGRKTANVVLSVAFGRPGLPVDTHVGRLSLRLGFTQEKDPVKVEKDLMSWVPPPESGAFSLRLILHGRKICIARKPRCVDCVIGDLCPSFRIA